MINKKFLLAGRPVGRPISDDDFEYKEEEIREINDCLLYTSPSPRDRQKSRMPSSA